MSSIDRLGNCPHCNKSWDGGDIRESIARMDIHQFKTVKELDDLAASFGWTPEDRKRFSKLRVYELHSTTTIYECPDCMYVYNVDSGEEMMNIHSARGHYSANTPTEELETSDDSEG